MTERDQLPALVTGAAGLIGSELCRQLVAQGRSVIAIDRDPDACRRLAGLPNTSILVEELGDLPGLGALVASASAVYHLGAMVGVRNVLDNARDPIDVDIEVCRVISDAAARTGTPVVFASSSEVYGHTAGEDAAGRSIAVPTTLGARAGYALGKAVGEFVLLHQHRPDGRDSAPVRIARLFSITGPDQSPNSGMVLPRFVSDAVAGSPLRVFQPGTQTRAFLHVADAAAGLMALERCPNLPPQFVTDLGAPPTSAVTMVELAEAVVAATRSSSSVQIVDPAETLAADFYDFGVRRCDAAELSRLTGWTPTRSLGQIIDDIAVAHRPGNSARPSDRGGGLN